MDSFATISLSEPAPGLPSDEEKSSGKTFVCVVARTDDAFAAPADEEKSSGKTFVCVIA